MKGIIQELKVLLKTKSIGTDSDWALLLDFQAAIETKPEKAIKLEKDALAQIENITADNARLVSNLHANLGGLYRMNGHPDLAREHMEKSISLLDQFNLLHINDSISLNFICLYKPDFLKSYIVPTLSRRCFTALYVPSTSFPASGVIVPAHTMR